MAGIQLKLPNEIIKKLGSIESGLNEIVSDCLEDGGKVVLSETRSRLDAVIGTGTKEPSRSTGKLKRALGVTEVRTGRDGAHNIKVGFSENRPDGKNNAMLANVLEYGKHGQPAKPFLKPARKASEKPAVEAMQKRFTEEVEKR